MSFSICFRSWMEFVKRTIRCFRLDWNGVARFEEKLRLESLYWKCSPGQFPLLGRRFGNNVIVAGEKNELAPIQLLERKWLLCVERSKIPQTIRYGRKSYSLIRG